VSINAQITPDPSTIGPVRRAPQLYELAVCAALD
jgi:hypothetical protein